MTTSKRWLLLALPVLLAGCLEVDQHPAWIKGKYAGKRDQQPYEQHFHGDRLGWWATLSNRALRQNEYNRAKPPEPPSPAFPMQPGAQATALQRAQIQREQVRQTYSQQVQQRPQAQQLQAQQPQAPGSRAGPPTQPATQQPRQRQPDRGG